MTGGELGQGRAVKKVSRPALMKQVVAYVAQSHGYSERRACSLTCQHRSTQPKPGVRNPRIEIRQRMHEIARTRIRHGYRRVHIMLRRDGWAVGRHLVWHLYREEGLALRAKRPRRRKMVVRREARCMPKQPNEARSLDFVHDQLGNGWNRWRLVELSMARCSAYREKFHLNQWIS